MKTGKVVRVVSKPRGFVLRVPPNPGPPPTPEEEIAYLCDADDFLVACAAYGKGSDADVSGTAPACSGVTAK